MNREEMIIKNKLPLCYAQTPKKFILSLKCIFCKVQNQCFYDEIFFKVKI